MIEGRLVARRGRHWVVTMLDKQIPLLTGSLVRDGQTQIRVTLMWEITTSAGILMGTLTVCGATPLIQKLKTGTAQFHYVPR